MFEILPRVEQLETIARLLDQDTFSAARLALILADNFAEIVMHGRARHEFAKEQYYRGYRPARWSATKRHRVMEDFDSKVNFLSNELGLVDTDDVAFFKFGHSVRNRAYHADAYHADVISPVARTYFGKICRLYPRLRISSVGISSSEAEADFLKRYNLSAPLELINGGLKRICEDLTVSRDWPITDVVAALSMNLVRRIDAILGNEDEIGFLETILDGQARDDAAQEEMRKRIQFVDCYEHDPNPNPTDEEFRAALARWETEFAKFAGPVTLCTLRRWRGTAESIGRDAAAGRAAERFETLDKQFSTVEDLVHQAVREFDEWVNQQVRV